MVGTIMSVNVYIQLVQTQVDQKENMFCLSRLMCRTERALLRRFSSLQFGLAMTFLQNHPLGNGLPSGLFQQVDRFIITTLRIPNTRTGPLPPLPPVPPPASPRGTCHPKLMSPFCSSSSGFPTIPSHWKAILTRRC